jgi:hypothetical protein
VAIETLSLPVLEDPEDPKDDATKTQLIWRKRYTSRLDDSTFASRANT